MVQSLTHLKCFVQIAKSSLSPCWNSRTMCTKLDGKQYKCKLLVIGGGTGGCSVAAKFAKKMSKCDIIVVEPSDLHYYQPLYTLIGAGLGKLRDAVKPTILTLPENVTWLKDGVQHFCPVLSSIITQGAKIVQYEYMVIATGLELHLEKVKGLKEGLELQDNITTVCAPEYAEKTFRCFNRFASGNAVFTHPSGKVKYASQEMCFLAEDFFRKHDKLCDAHIHYVTAQRSIFYVDKYTRALEKIAKKKNIETCFKRDLIEINPECKTVTFEEVGNPGKKCTIRYDLLHVTPPMRTIKPVRECRELANEEGFVDVDKETLQHKKYPNVFALGDCASLPTSKTASAVAVQANIVHQNLKSVMEGKEPKAHYDGYSAWPIFTSYSTCILPEYDYMLHPQETFPFRQERESKFVYFLKKNIMPTIYWKLFLTGHYRRASRCGKLFSWYKSKK